MACALTGQLMAAPSPLVGRWETADAKQVLEFLADGTLVTLAKVPTVQTRKQPDGSRTTNIMTQVISRVGLYPLAADQPLTVELVTGTQSHARSHRWGWQLNGASDTLTITDAGTNTMFRRADLAVPDGQRPLIGLWRRSGDRLPIHEADTGILFTPGGVGVYLGKSSPWDRNSGGGSAGWFCRTVSYRVVREGELEETDLTVLQPRQRVRPFRVTDSHLQIGPVGPYGLHYDRIRGPFAFLDGQFNAQHWLRLPLLGCPAAP